MDFKYSEEQTLLKDSLARFLKDSYDFDSFRKILDSDAGYSPEHWAQLAELQYLALPFSEDDGGMGFGPVEVLLASEALGQGLCIEPWMANIMLSAQLLVRTGGQAELLGQLLQGQTQVSFAHAESEGRFNLLHCTTRANGDSLSGAKSVVLNAPNAEHFIVLARHADGDAGLGLYLLKADAPGVSVRGYQLLGGGVAGELTLENAAATRLDSGNAAEIVTEVVDLATAASCAEAYGAMQALMAKTLDYMKQRKQFGVAIGSFQVIQHRLVDMFIEVQQTQSMILMLSLRLQDAEPLERQKAVSAAKAYIHKSSRFVAEQAVQLHGGIGMTDELDIGHYFRRLTALGALFGDRRHHVQRYKALTQQVGAQATLSAAA